MGVNRAQIDRSGNFVQSQPVGERLLSQFGIVADTTAGASTISVAALLAGVVNRSGPAAGYTDTFPAAANVLAAQPDLSVGDNFEFIFRNTVAQAMTAAAGEGVVLGTNVDVAASLVREYLITILGTGPRQIFSGNLVNGSATVTGVPLANAALVQPGQGVTGTGIPANTTVLSVNANTGTIALSANATATATNALTTFPRYSVQGIRSATL